MPAPRRSRGCGRRARRLSAANAACRASISAAESQRLAPQLDGLVEVLRLHGQPVAAGRDRRIPRGGSRTSGAAAIRRRPDRRQSCRRGSVRSTRRAAPLPAARASSASDGRAIRLSPTTMPRPPALLDATIQRGERRLEPGDGSSALVLHVQQSKPFGLVIGDPLQQGTRPGAIRRAPTSTSDWLPHATGAPPRRRSAARLSRVSARR